MRQISEARPVTLTGKFTPFRQSHMIGVPDQPVYVTLHEQPRQLWCVVFSDVGILHETMLFCGIKDYKIKHIDDGKDFAESVLESGRVRLMLDPVLISKEKTRWTEVVLD